MSLLQVTVLAAIQGFTEFLPISSSAHLALAPWLLGWKDQGLAFDIALHLGTLAAVLVYFFRDWLQILAQGFGLRFGHDPELKRNPTMLWLLALGSLPIGVLGYIFKEHAETTLRSPFVIATMLIAVAILMAIAERASRRQKTIEHVNTFDALAIGLAQAIAIIPGTSRSGITITAGLARNLERAAAARFSFLLSTPAIAAAGAKAFYDLHKAGGVPPDMTVPFILGIFLSAISGLAAIGFLMRYLRHASLHVFIYYRIVFGIIVFALAILRSPAE
ncbi:MAG: undecaprenyl-diphosphate phosphatase [Bryobacterales bacterium]|nr:undecaprenyl-diphosphate phosphatase [Bryobacterales bacterium]